MIFFSVLLFLLASSEVMRGYDLAADLARGLVYNDSIIAESTSDGGKFLSDYPEDCAAIYLNGKTLDKPVSSGIYEIWPREGKPFFVQCDMITDGGGWTVFQKRDDFVRLEDFYRTWLEYKRGFGNLQEQFWLGNDRLFMLTNQNLYQLRVDLEDFDGEKRYAGYYSFRVADESDKYRLTIGAQIQGDAGDSLSIHNGMQFSTKDLDNDRAPGSCAQKYNGAWWYDHCHQSNLNGPYLRGHHPTSDAQGVNWYTFRGPSYSLKRTEMKIRPVWFKP